MSEPTQESTLPEVDLTAAARSIRSGVDAGDPRELAEIIATPPPRLLRGLLYMMSGLLLLALIWSYYGRYDVIVSARGLLSPTKPTGVVQTPAAGLLAEVLAAEGQSVQRGQPIARIQPLEGPRALTLAAPVAGELVGIGQHQPGEILPPGQTIAEVWQGGDWMVPIQIANQDVGKVREGMPVRIKIDALPYQEFGALKGELGTVSLLPASAAGKASESLQGPAGYSAIVTLRWDDSNGKRLRDRMRPGMALTAEIVVDRRPILQMLLDRM